MSFKRALKIMKNAFYSISCKNLEWISRYGSFAIFNSIYRFQLIYVKTMTSSLWYVMVRYLKGFQGENES